MARQLQDQEQGRQEGARWIDRRPSGTEVAEWYAKNVRVDALLDAEHYLPGITLIPATEYGPDVDNNGQKIKHQVFTPYPKVEARVAYFWDWCDAHEYLGEIELQAAPTPNKHLPEGFFSMPVQDLTGKVVPFVGVSYRIHIYSPNIRDGGKGRPVRIPPAGTKVVPLLKKGYNGVISPDPDAIHKAQTGAIGRALGYAGILVIPGAGVATAEDMQEFIEREPGLQVDPPAAIPATHMLGGTDLPATAPANLGELVGQLKARLESEFPATYEEVAAWAHEKGFDIADPPDDALRGLERQLTRKLTAAAREAERPV